MRIISLTLLAFALSAAAQELPQAPAVHPKPIIDYSEYLGVIAVNAADWISTQQCQRELWKCHEAELPTPLVRSKAGFAAFEVGKTIASIEGQRFLERHHHAKLARYAQLAQIASTAITVANNYRIEDRKMK